MLAGDNTFAGEIVELSEDQREDANLGKALTGMPGWRFTNEEATGHMNKRAADFWRICVYLQNARA